MKAGDESYKETLKWHLEHNKLRKCIWHHTLKTGGDIISVCYLQSSPCFMDKRTQGFRV